MQPRPPTGVTPLRYYPVSLNVARRSCLVVGGGRVGTRKARGLLACAAQVTVVSPEASAEIRRWADAGELRWLARRYTVADLEGRFLVIGASDDARLNRDIHLAAERRNLLCNIVDRPEAGTFILPAVMRRGDLTVAVSTSGASPAFARALRGDLEARFGDEYARFLALMRAVRRHLAARAEAPDQFRRVYRRLIDAGLLDLVRREDRDAIATLLRDALGVPADIEALLAAGFPRTAGDE
jgi:precorrin-2 dehydrogenase/sirohydrochlorin ferrochelatase